MTAAARALAPVLTVEDWAALEEDVPGELVDGQLVEEEVPQADHETIVGWLYFLLYGWAIPRGGFVFVSELKYALGPGQGRKPDLSLFFPGGTRPVRRGVQRIPPDIMVEVISSDPRDVRRDRIEKAREYAAFGVRFYWLVDPGARTLEVFELQASGRYLTVLGAAGGVVDAPGCAGLRLDLDALWAEVDRLGPEAPAPSATKTKAKKTKRRRP